MLRAILLLVLALLAACGDGPDAERLKADVAARLADALPAGTVTLEALHRRGSQTDVKAPAGETRRIVYFDADLKLVKDYDFGAWDSPGVAGVVSALGSGPKGIVGIVSGGNRTGDLIRAHGTAIYQQDGDGWVAVAPEGFRVVVAPDFAAGAPRPAPEAMLDAMRAVIANAPLETSAAARDVIMQELEGANAAIRARLARAANGYAIAAGPAGGQYLRFAQALGGGKTQIAALVTAGGEENLRMVRDGRAPLGLVQGDSALLAFGGKDPFEEEGPYSTMRAVGSLYPEAVHIIVRADSALRSVSALAGRRVAIGVPGSASRTTAVAVLKAHGIALERLAKMVELPLNEALVALRQKEIDSLVHVIGFPADSIRDATAEVPLRLLELEERAVRSLAAASPAYLALALPKGTYPNQGTDVRTVATAAILLVGSDLTDAEVAALTRTLYARGTDMVARGSAQGAQISPASARLGLAVPLHSAAARVLDELVPPKPGKP